MAARPRVEQFHIRQEHQPRHTHRHDLVTTSAAATRHPLRARQAPRHHRALAIPPRVLLRPLRQAATTKDLDDRSQARRAYQGLDVADGLSGGGAVETTRAAGRAAAGAGLGVQGAVQERVAAVDGVDDCAADSAGYELLPV